ncbi:F-box associated ubiquitination effector family protein [Raphanus sativus]|uniref:F-box protein At1g53360 n=1 Tax=Raphanus sativus TaxID=3726 RepID=A0A6J0KRL3_RAPSA|nr:putative F-box protein At1g53360 [Raphanus sativus]KAJ4880858.1 F-box associated ubiquitination effector family protein [Raphanus sativus]
MKNMEQQSSEGLVLTTSGHETQSANSVREYSVPPIPDDMLMEIFSRVPAKSIARFRCVSKFLGSILRRPDFNYLFLTKSLTRGRFLFALEVDEKLFFCSSPQPHNPNDNSSLVATPYQTPMIFPEKISFDNPSTLCRLVLPRQMRVICNPATGDFLTLPNVLKENILPNGNPVVFERLYFGYDPIGKRFKVLCITSSRDERPNTYQVLTLESGKLLWRMVECKFHFETTLGRTTDICINGVLYFEAKMEKSTVIVCFDVRSEKFGFINMEQKRACELDSLELFNYRGKLGIHHKKDDIYGTRLVLWVLEDARNHNWCKLDYALSPLDKEMVKHTKFVGVTGRGEIVYSSYPFRPVNWYFLLFNNVESMTSTRVKVEGLEVEEGKKDHFINTLIGYVENLEFM